MGLDRLCLGDWGDFVIVYGEDVCHYVARETSGEYYAGSGQGIGIERDGEIVCGVMFDQHNGRSVQIHVALKPGARMTKEWLHTLFWYAFCQLKVTKIIGIVESTNLAALKFDRHIGFRDEAVIRDAGRDGDLIILSMIKNDCKYLRK
jgi:RimJ/RimL family protein N-acetyltransferase